MKLREHRRGLHESLATTVEIEPTTEALLEVIRAALAPYGVAIAPASVRVEPYGFDARIGWDTHIVVVGGYGVFGFTDGPLSAPPVCHAV